MGQEIKKFGDPIDVEWTDAVSYAGWYSEESLKKTPAESYCRSRGLFIREDKTFLVIAHTVSQDEALGVQYIPITWIISRK
jgi:hypothetical protein